MNRIVGVNRDILDLEAVRSIPGAMERTITRTIIPIFLEDKTIASRCIDVGFLTHQQALAMGAAGPPARASGVAQDIRKAAPCAAYEQIQFEVRVEQDGDVRAVWWFMPWR